MQHSSAMVIKNAQNRTWMDRLLDLIVGDESPSSKYALICEKCFFHNGLVVPEEFFDTRNAM